MYISLLIIPCIIYYVTNKETLTLKRVKITLHSNIVTLRSKNKNNPFKVKLNILNKKKENKNARTRLIE